MRELSGLINCPLFVKNCYQYPLNTIKQHKYNLNLFFDFSCFTIFYELMYIKLKSMLNIQIIMGKCLQVIIIMGMLN